MSATPLLWFIAGALVAVCVALIGALVILRALYDQVTELRHRLSIAAEELNILRRYVKMNVLQLDQVTRETVAERTSAEDSIKDGSYFRR